MICIDEAKMKKNSAGYLGKLRSNFLGTEFYIYDGGDNPKKAKNMEEARTQLGVVEYEKNVLGSKGPRRMKVLLPRIERDGSAFEWKSNDVRLPKSFHSPYYRKIIRSRTCSRQAPKRTSSSSSTSLPNGMNVNIMLIKLIFPLEVQAFVLNFNGRVDKASVKNFQLIDDFDDNKIYMQFGRIGKHKFNMDVAFPFSIFQAFSIALSSFDFKFACE